jgi:hypothetical protein
MNNKERACYESGVYDGLEVALHEAREALKIASNVYACSALGRLVERLGLLVSDEDFDPENDEYVMSLAKELGDRKWKEDNSPR